MLVIERPARPARSHIALDPAIFALAMDHNPNLVFVKDAASRFVYANRAVFELFAPPQRDKVIGYTMAENFSPEETALFLEEDRRAFDAGKSDIVEEIVDYRGVSRTLMTQKIAFCSADGEHLLLGISTDISDLARRERDLVRANAMLENFAALAAHDLRSPLSTFVGCVSMIRHDAGTVLSPIGQTYVDMMERSATNLAHQISGLLGAYKARNQGAIDCASTDLNILFEEVRFNLRDLIQRTGATVAANRLPTVDIDANLFRHLVMNLIENSIKYRGPANPAIVFRGVRDGDGWLFDVEDNGIGVRPEDEARMFKFYEQADGKSGNGVGLGLPLCRNIVELHGGRIWIDHDYRAGTRIRFTIRPDS